MKDLIRQKITVQEAVVDLLNKQVKLEAQSSAAYLAMGAWCDRHGYDHSAQFFYNQSDEERTHMLKIFHYISNMGGQAQVPTVNAPQHDFSSFRELFEVALEAEISVTTSINKIVMTCRKSDDFSTENFMQWFVKEQVEEEFVMRKALGLFDMLEDNPESLLLIDERVSKIEYKES